MKFQELDLTPEVMQGIETMNFEQMTPVQEQTIPVIMTGRDLIGCAQTGTGKTAAYILPLLDRLVRQSNRNDNVRALIVVPTRELAQQIDVQLQGFAYFLPVSTTIVHGSGGGIEWSWQKTGMTMGADIVVATPGRLLAHLENSGVDLSHVEYFVLDEADRMLDMGFSDDITKIVSNLPPKRQNIMFSATMPPKIRDLARKIMHSPAEVSIAISRPNEAIEQIAYICRDGQKLGLVQELFGKPKETKTLIFASSKLKVKELAFALKRMKLNVAAMHSDLDQPKREEVMLDFKNGKIDILVATDVVARGIDIADIGTVVNFDVPRDPEDYIHRIGRTARASAEGTAITFVNEHDQGAFHRIEEFLGREIEKRPLPDNLGSAPSYNPGSTGQDRGRGRGGHRPGDRRNAQGRAGQGQRRDKPHREAGNNDSHPRKNREGVAGAADAPHATQGASSAAPKVAAPAVVAPQNPPDSPKQPAGKIRHWWNRRRKGGDKQ